MLFEGRSSPCPRALRDVWLGEVSREAGLSVNVPMLATDVCAAESGTGFTDTAEPAAASRDCVPCMELKPFLGCTSF